MLTQYAFSILFIDKKKAKFSNDRFGLKQACFAHDLLKKLQIFTAVHNLMF